MTVRGIDLFCGAGGSSWGAKMGGVEIVGAVDQWQIATSTFADNFPAARGNVVTTVLTDKTGAGIFPALGSIDLILASPECTNHSLARGSKPKCSESQRSGWYITSFIEDLQPQHIVIENVAMMQHWSGYDDLCRTLEKRYGFKLRAQVLDAADFGVPQRRKRLFLFGSKGCRPPKVVVPGKKIRPASAILDPRGTWKTGLLDNGRRAEATLDRVNKAIEIIGEGTDFLTVYYGSDKAGGYQLLDRPLRTLTTLDRFGLIEWHGRVPTLRMLQVPELKRAMGIPQKFVMNQGTRRDRVRLMGNGVCPPVMAAVVRTLLDASPTPKKSSAAKVKRLSGGAALLNV